MTNRYYNESFAAALGTQARSAALESQFKLIQDGFDLLNLENDEVLGRDGNFSSLGQVPPSMANAAGQYVRVNAAGTALEYVSGGRLGIKSFSATSYTAILTDPGNLLLSTNAADVTFTVPPVADVAFAQGDVICVNQYGLGQVTFAPGAGVSIYSTDGLMKTRKQYAEVALICVGADAWLLVGERNAATLGFAGLAGGNAFTGAQTVAFQALTDGATINTDASLSNHYSVTLGGNRTLANPTNLRDGGIYNFYVKQDGTGARTLAYGSLFKWPGGTAPVLTTAANSLDLIIAQYSSTLNILACSITKDVR
jgi:hypothetical protein